MPGGAAEFFPAQGAAGVVGAGGGVGAGTAIVLGEAGREPDRDVKATWLGWAVAAMVVCVAR